MANNDWNNRLNLNGPRTALSGAGDDIFGLRNDRGNVSKGRKEHPGIYLCMCGYVCRWRRSRETWDEACTIAAFSHTATTTQCHAHSKIKSEQNVPVQSYINMQYKALTL